MADKKPSKKSRREPDSIYVLKLVIYMILGAQWLKIMVSGGDNQIPVPAGALIAIALASHDRFKIDRKIEYAVILVAMFIGFWLPLGLEISWR